MERRSWLKRTIAAVIGLLVGGWKLLQAAPPEVNPVDWLNVMTDAIPYRYRGWRIWWGGWNAYQSTTVVLGTWMAAAGHRVERMQANCAYCPTYLQEVRLNPVQAVEYARLEMEHARLKLHAFIDELEA